MGNLGRSLVLGASCVACSAAKAPPAQTPAVAAVRTEAATSTAEPGLAAYCEQARKRRAAFQFVAQLEVRAVSLVPRQGYQALALGPANQPPTSASVSVSRIFLAPGSIVSDADLDGLEVEKSWQNDGRYDVLGRVKSAKALALQLKPLVGGAVAVMVEGRLLSLPRLQAPEIWRWPVAQGLTLSEARALVARLGPAFDVDALELLEQRCFDGEAASCSPLAEERLLGADTPYDPERAVALFEAGCLGGVGTACERASELATQAEHRSLLLERACRLGRGNACVEGAAKLLQRRRVPNPRAAEGRAALVRGCDQGGGLACLALADVLAGDFPDADQPTPEELRPWLRLLERGCEHGEAQACFRTAEVARWDRVVERDLVAVLRWLRAGCALDSTGGALSVRLEHDKPDPWLAGALKEAGCTGELAPPAPRPALCRAKAAH